MTLIFIPCGFGAAPGVGDAWGEPGGGETAPDVGAATCPNPAGAAGGRPGSAAFSPAGATWLGVGGPAAADPTGREATSGVGVCGFR